MSIRENIRENIKESIEESIKLSIKESIKLLISQAISLNTNELTRSIRVRKRNTQKLRRKLQLKR